MKFAFFVYPHLGGTFTVFRHLRMGLAAFGIDVRWLGIGPAAHAAARHPDWQAERETGAVCGLPGDDEPALARALFAAIENGGFDGVFVNVHADSVQTNIARHLPSSLLRILVVHNITPGTYAAAAAIREHVHATVCVSRRIEADLIGRYRFRPQRIVTVPNAADFLPVPARAPRADGQPLRILSLGRVEDQAKGVLWLPDILRRLPPSVRMTVAGDGPDLARLRQRCAFLGDRVRFAGAVLPSAVPALMAEHDILLGPSRFEGFMITAVEAMAAGCVPVISRIRGVTDSVVTEGETGLLFPVGDIRAAASAIQRLVDHPALWRTLSRRGVATAPDRFGVARMAGDYAALLDRISAEPPLVARPLSMDEWQLPSGLRPGLRTHLPVPIKNLLRGIRERVRIRDQTAEPA
ncbi:glycosyl transferase [Kaistia sp. 32K]|uniref:glycosyltransferase family 4 protein n=1 Tax=Kaistia sp. 32K TaxID=2795690 RepID=UPI001915A6CF|nr:glycosyltransferase family 4 protein [Kaistia sp. 32K]BCP53483.1 glycosyl transferase [Kaistia sp. 32K]